MAKLLFLSNIPTPYQLDFLDRLAKLHDLRAIFLWSTELNRDWQLGNREWLEIVNYRHWSATASRLAALMRKMRPNAIIIGGHRLPFAGLVKWLGIVQGARVAYWLEKPLPAGTLKNCLRRWVWRARLPFAYGVAALGAEAVSVYAPFSRRTLNLPYSINVSRYLTTRGEIPSRPVRFLFVGQLIHRKGVAEMLDAFAAVPACDAELTVAGSGELKAHVESYVRRYPHIHFVGFVDPNTLPQLYSGHDVFIAPSRHDGWGVVVCEAMASGMPIVGTSATGAFAEYVQHGRNGFRCEVSVDSIREGILYYCGDHRLIHEHGTINRSLIASSSANAENAAAVLSSWMGLAH